ncbi:bifunctional 2-C-methyl-D-erythritol 4-phosphate cytidylyltransferase/2-C-methyl-D-erythritol 2,4-cyclodiphosphate synthase [Haematospirillum sp. H1815]|uniref:bifunctional 2-C-methyl-D-erythritol 4-phosphate cytidylyltransferase/2-C-methyl-D-erythritol 2,4-cyclodiphosphate synthase n=1 Tax=Haematospirillum sp. H1815 TaxID=2723108 RepID=UPI001438C67A|nr:bifunctional 2-C-methyl-D-erythritol 4-phosphate cytidylyltransferase/2-C-methyl-D-erythritol 2,4-cyclodiphosphate synthase [Haematospirillum sp. H1815]NKD76444.1 bifunctional 2-C-methyl-D-erythritol 4-phosphate cytidylyltransferase/2-C-methyl-D-erythritol 2,4-cyclodiphosphate synthase [Haematospirillum sp. H1815]
MVFPSVPASPKVYAIIVAAGRSNRFGGSVPKQYAMVNGQPVIRQSVCSFLNHPDIAGIQVVIHPDDEALYQKAVGDLPLCTPVFGGQERQDSVRNGLEALCKHTPDFVLIHDAARPFAGRNVIDAVLQALQFAPAAIPGTEVADTLKSVNSDCVVLHSISRKGLWRAQTPQGFHFMTILDAHRQCAGLSLTDDAALLEHLGKGPVRMVAGSAENYKITWSDDLDKSSPSPRVSMETRTGIGFDVHAFTTGNTLTLCGVSIPFSRKLSGHSDADVAMHALTDALYGCIGAGDIGVHFPPGKARWKDAPSRIFLEHACNLIRQQTGRITHVDITIICEEPKLGPYRQDMILSLARIMDIPESRVSIKATTTERLGFTGRKEGIAAQAIATALLPAG